MELKFIGCGSAFTDSRYWQSNMVLESRAGNLLIDCGSDARFSLPEAYPGLNNGNIHDYIQGVYISHLHADHIGGLEWLAFCTYFNPACPKLKLFCDKDLMPELWESSLKGGLESIEGKVMNLTDYFDCVPVDKNDYFTWGEAILFPVQTVHVVSGYMIKHSYGLKIVAPRSNTFLTTDTQYCPNQISGLYAECDLIFQDCETSPFPSGVHAHYNDLINLQESHKGKMWLYHYHPDPSFEPEKDGFLGFVEKGRSFTL